MDKPLFLLLTVLIVYQKTTAMQLEYSVPSNSKYTIGSKRTLSKSSSFVNDDFILEVKPKYGGGFRIVNSGDSGPDALTFPQMLYQQGQHIPHGKLFAAHLGFLAQPNKRTMSSRTKRRLSINHGLQVLSNILGNVRKPKQNGSPPSTRHRMLQNVKNNLVTLYESRHNDKDRMYKAHIKQKYSGYNKSTIAQLLHQIG